MARSYVNFTDYSDTDAEFTFETVDNNIYLKIGNLNDDDTALIVSIIAGGLVGFFQSGERIAIARITADYDETDGIRVESIPEDLTLNEEYVIKFTQARPGRFGEQGKQGERGEQGPPGRDGMGPCHSLAVLNDPDGTQNLRSIALPADYDNYNDVYIAIHEGNELRSNTLKIAVLVNGRRYRIGASNDVEWVEATRTFNIVGGNNTGEFRHIILIGCETEAEADIVVASGRWDNPVVVDNTTLAHSTTPGFAPTPQLSEWHGTWMRVGNVVQFNLTFEMQGFRGVVERVRISLLPPVGTTFINCRGQISFPRDFYANAVIGQRRQQSTPASDEDAIRILMNADTGSGYDWGGTGARNPFNISGQYYILSE